MAERSPPFSNLSTDGDEHDVTDIHDAVHLRGRHRHQVEDVLSGVEQLLQAFVFLSAQVRTCDGEQHLRAGGRHLVQQLLVDAEAQLSNVARAAVVLCLRLKNPPRGIAVRRNVWWKHAIFDQVRLATKGCAQKLHVVFRIGANIVA
jgi:hypothetical protein